MRLLQLASAPRSRVALSVGLGTVTALCAMGLMATAGYLISRAAEQPAVLSLTVAIVGVRFFGLARPVSRYFDRLASHDLALRSLGVARTRVYERIEPLAPAQLTGYRSGDLLSRLVADVDAMQNLYLRGIGPPLVALAAGITSIAVTAAILPTAALILAVGLTVGGIAVPALAATAAHRTARTEADARGALSAELVETMRAAPELAVYGLIDDRLERVCEADRKVTRAARAAAVAAGAGDGLRILVTGATAVGVLAVAVDAHADGSLDRVLIALLALLAIASFEPIQPLAQAAVDLSQTFASGRRLLELTAQEPVVVDPTVPLSAPKWPFAIELSGVRVPYTNREIDLRLQPGARVALVGPSGIGKTTVVNLLVRFLDPEVGTVLLAGRDLREYRQEDVRRAIAVAGQDSHLFSTSIRENARLGTPGATDDEIEDALGRARILDWVRSLPAGLDTLVGEEGRQLSGGQRQRLVVARALLANAPVLVLDEPTAHLDPETAQSLVDDVLDASAGKSVLLITHRPEGLDRMDEVLRLG
jgi:ATP-binding cassette, subfamily C, bacterial CydC